MSATRLTHSKRVIIHSKIHQLGTRVLANDTGVITRSDLIGCLGNCARHEDHLFVISSHGRCEGCIAGDCGCGTAGATSCASVETRVAGS